MNPVAVAAEEISRLVSTEKTVSDCCANLDRASAGGTKKSLTDSQIHNVLLVLVNLLSRQVRPSLREKSTAESDARAS